MLVNLNEQRGTADIKSPSGYIPQNLMGRACLHDDEMACLSFTLITSVYRCVWL